MNMGSAARASSRHFPVGVTTRTRSRSGVPPWPGRRPPGGGLFVTGRRKDLLAIHGANYYPPDFERIVQQAHPALGGESAAAYTCGDSNRVIVVVETSCRNDPATAIEAASAAVRAVTAELPVATDVVVVPRGQLPRTASGKARRQECARRMRYAQLQILARWPRDSGPIPDRPGTRPDLPSDGRGSQ
jgi:acyl-CoA synthetase (AMP-forming)/AMP-acid ligase II